ncbi:hypothetical protein EIP91_004695 [Steccherinum ochraceum]|uniref:BTB domain-containing protein n=1 Tax=Steccherinum ochraceum TaxID=92696 RepID=A0A4R0RBF1_9APHY|nr:hypothetical protein EIP91_004695 [Steccherinum ochraceum]
MNMAQQDSDTKQFVPHDDRDHSADAPYHPLFSGDGDVVLSASDGMSFKVHAVVLKTTSGWFNTLLTLPQAPDAFANPIRPLESLHVSEESSVLLALLQIICGLAVPDIPTIDLAEAILAAAEKYDMPGPISLIRKLIMHPPIISSFPLRVYSLACKWGWQAEAREASTHTLRLDILGESCMEQLKHCSMPCFDLAKLLTLHRDRRAAVRAALNDETRFSANRKASCLGCSRPLQHAEWEKFKTGVIAMLETHPFGTQFSIDDLQDPSATFAMLGAACSGCQKPMYNTEATIRALQLIVNELPKRLPVSSPAEYHLSTFTTLPRQFLGALFNDRFLLLGLSIWCAAQLVIWKFPRLSGEPLGVELLKANAIFPRVFEPTHVVYKGSFSLHKETRPFFPSPVVIGSAPIMEIFMQNIAFSATKHQIKTEIARVIHGPDYAQYSNGRPLNLEVYILPKRKNRNSRRPGRQGKLTLPYVEVGHQFLREYGGRTPRRRVIIGTAISFTLSNVPPRSNVVEFIRRYPYVDPYAQEDLEALENEVQAHPVTINTLQFAWECRDDVFSVEFERDCGGGHITFNGERREFHIEAPRPAGMEIVAIRAGQIVWAAAGSDGDKQVICLRLDHAPSYELDTSRRSSASSIQGLDHVIFGLMQLDVQHILGPPLRLRQGAFDEDHSHTVAWSSHALRIVCPRASDLQEFRALCRAAHIKVDDFIYPVVRRQLFSLRRRTEYAEWVQGLVWPVAFQVTALSRSLLFDLREILSFREQIDTQILTKGFVYTASFLRHFISQSKAWNCYTDDSEELEESALEFFVRSLGDFAPPSPQRLDIVTTDLFECMHIIVSPTTMWLEGPYPERSNRIIRQYPRDHDSFLRVSFVDENNLQYRFDREVDGRAFIQKRVGDILSKGLSIAGRHFDFLAYSQSALKEHAVWFVKPFDYNGRRVDAASIIAGIGNFGSMPSDPRLIYCPARYGARISQAFTATDSSIAIQADQIKTLPDVKSPDGLWFFTDGVGTISPDLAKEIWRELNRRRKRRNRKSCPPAFQIRFQGSKGMVSVDYQLTGRVICLRPSMIKFEAPDSNNIEIARAFDRPGPFNLNRPLIMILEGLGVPFETFYDLQRRAVTNAQESMESLSRAAKLLETYGLGSSYQLPSVMLSLDKLGVGALFWDDFWNQMMTFAIHHVLRELKHHARIPVPDAYNLVGVADVHGFLKEGEIFVHIRNVQDESHYFSGPTMVSRSPSIHRGDVQIAHAIGRPPPGSPFAHQSLPNCIVFSIHGKRPLASCLGGGDLDGDLFGVTMLPSMLPRQTYDPAPYTAAGRKELDRRSTMQDVADFVVEYIYSDNLGVIASNWLVIADKSPQGVHDVDCLRLAQLHSDAVDYPKSGRPVPLTEIPKHRYHQRQRPDWDAPETKITAETKEYYPSDKYIGRLFREIDLPAVPEAQRAQWDQGRRIRREHEEWMTPDEVLEAFNDEEDVDEDGEDLVRNAVEGKVLHFIALGRHDDEMVSEVWEIFTSYRSQLQTICADNSISRNRSAMLTEEEAAVGTIVAKCSQPRLRREKISKLREQTNALVQGVAHQLEGEIGTLPEKSLERAWVAYRLSQLTEYFGAKSFRWIALRQVFDAIRVIENENDGFF